MTYRPQILTVPFGGTGFVIKPGFLVYPSAPITNVTGDGTVYTCVFNTVVFDQDSNFSSSTTFTAPVAGKYLFCIEIGAENLGAGHTVGEIDLVTTARSYRINRANYANTRDGGGGNACAFGGAVIANMALNDTATVTLTVTGSTKSVTFSGGATNSSFSGGLFC